MSSHSQEESYRVVSQTHFVNLTILTEAHAYGVEKKFPKEMTIGELKNKLELISGYAANQAMKLTLLDKDKHTLCCMDDEERMLGYYPCEDGYFVQVTG